MAVLGEVTSKETKITLLGSYKKMSAKKLPTKNIFSNMQTSVTTNFIDPKRISKNSTSCLNACSMVKAGVIFSTTVGVYCLAKATKILSYFVGKGKDANPKSIKSQELVNAKNFLSRRVNSKMASRINSPSVNRIEQIYKKEKKLVEFEEIEVKDLKNKNKGSRRSIINPTFIGSYDTPGWAYEVALSGNYAYVADEQATGQSGLQIIDVTNPSNPKFKGLYSASDAHDVVLAGNYAYVTNPRGLLIIDISDPGNPILKGSRDLDSAFKVAISGNYAYVVDSGLQIIDISNPSNPTLKGSCDHCSGKDIAIAGNYAYVAGGLLHIIDISNPSNPTLKGSLSFASVSAYGVAVSGNYAYVADLELGLQIIDVNDPENPVLESSYEMPDDDFYVEVALSGDYAYIGSSKSGLYVIDVKDPLNLSFKSSYVPESKCIKGITFSGNYAYIAACDSGLQIITKKISGIKIVRIKRRVKKKSYKN
jgi:hypothetical protein